MQRYVVLGFLRSGTALHGYALMKAYRERSGVTSNSGSLYRELQHLVGEGLVRTVASAPAADRRRSLYEITTTGVTEFNRWMATRPEIGDRDDELSGRAVFAAEAEPAVTRRLLDRWRDELWIRGKVLERERETVLTQGPGQGHGFTPLVVLLNRRLKHLAADLEFIGELRATLDDWEARAARESKSRERHGPTRPSKRGTPRSRSARRRGA